MKRNATKITVKDRDLLLDNAVSVIGGKLNDYSHYILLGKISAYLQAANTQQRRITRNLTEKKSTKNLPQLFCDIHFYLTSCFMIHKLTEKLKKLPTKHGSKENIFPHLGSLNKNYRVFQGKNEKARHYLEHIDERMQDDAKRLELSQPNIFSSLEGTVLNLGGERVDIGSSNIQQLRKYVAELKCVMLTDSLEFLSKHSPSDLDRIKNNLARNKFIQTLATKINRETGKRRKYSKNKEK